MKIVWLRILFGVLILVSIYFLPWWFVLIEAFIFFLVFLAPEGLLAGVFLDALYPSAFFDFAFFFTLLLLLFFIGSRYLRQYIIIYD